MVFKQRHVSALIDLNVFCIIFVLDGLTIQPDFVIFFIGVSTPGKNRTQFIDQYNTSANKRISYSSRLFEVTCCRIKNGGGCQHPSIDCQLFVHCFVVYFFCCMGMVHPQYFIHYIVCIHSSGISLFFACYNGVRHAIFKIFI